MKRRWLAGVLAVTVGACSVEVEDTHGPTSSVAQLEVESIAEQLAEHPAFDNVSMASYRRLDRSLETFGALTPAQRSAVKNALTACSNGAVAPCMDELALLGVSLSLSSAEAAGMNALLVDTDLDALDLDARREAFLEATKLRDAATGNASWDELVPPMVDGQVCKAACRAAFMAEFAEPHADMLAAMSSLTAASSVGGNVSVADSGVGGERGDDLAVAPAVATDIPLEDATIDLILLGILALIAYCATHDCTPDAPADSECQHDDECDGDEYCNKGFLGIGQNACVPAKSLDESCGRHAECLSNCCKGGFIGIGKECKPASSCN